MRYKVWNAELARVAQNYAERCIFGHNDQRTSQQNTFRHVGENLAITTEPNINYTNLVRGWYDENEDYTYETNRCNAVCGHYTQVRA